MNHDGVVDINDVTDIIARVLGITNPEDTCAVCANVDDDNVVDINDVTTLIAFVLNGAWPE